MTVTRAPRNSSDAAAANPASPAPPTTTDTPLNSEEAIRPPSFNDTLGDMTTTLLLLLALLLPAQPPQRAAPAGDLRARVEALIRASGAEVSVAMSTLDGRERLSIDTDREYHAASTMKVPVMIELFRQAETGKLSLDEQLPIKNEFHSIVDGSVYTLDVGDDSDAQVYHAIGKTLSLRQLCEAMITVSSNFAANLLIERLGVENIRHTVAALGAPGMHVLRGVEDNKAFDKGMNNTTTAEALRVLLDKIATGHAVSAKADAEMVAILKRQKFADAIPAGLPAGTVVAHKTGNITKIHHDAAIVYGPRPYVLVVLVRGIAEQKQSGALIASISREIWSGLER
jgi:beta-lactamase class A